jgi:hypothetical protein
MARRRFSPEYIERKDKNVKHKRAVALIAIFATTVSLASSAEKQASMGEVFLLKAGGKTLAELRVRGSGNLALQTSQGKYDMRTRTLSGSGGAVLTLRAGTNSISVRADEIVSGAIAPSQDASSFWHLMSGQQVLADIRFTGGRQLESSGNVQIVVGGGRTVWKGRDENTPATLRILVDNGKPAEFTAEQVILDREIDGSPNSGPRPK